MHIYVNNFKILAMKKFWYDLARLIIYWSTMHLVFGYYLLINHWLDTITRMIMTTIVGFTAPI